MRKISREIDVDPKPDQEKKTVQDGLLAKLFPMRRGRPNAMRREGTQRTFMG